MKAVKKLLSIIFIIFISTSCIDENEKFIGYLVAKEYTPEHMCCDGTKTYCYAGYVPRVPVVPPKPHVHSKKYAEYYWYLANKEEVLKKRVSKKLFNSKKLGTKIKIKKH